MPNQHLKSFLILIFVGLTAASVSQASIIYSAPPNQSGGSDLNSYLEADDVTVAAPSADTALTFWALQDSASDYAGSIAWSLNANVAPGMPGASVYSGSANAVAVPTGQSAFGLNEFRYSFPIGPIAPGTYWVVLHNGPDNAIPGTDFFWEWSNGNSGNSQSQDLSAPNSPWLGNFSELALQLENAPEPSSMLLLGTGLLALGLVRGRKR